MRTLLFLLLLASVPAQDFNAGKRLTDWVSIAEADAPRSTLSYSQKSIKRNKDLITVWGKWEFPYGWKQGGMEIGSVRGLFTLDCQRRQVIGRAIILYSPNNRILHENKKREDIKEAPGTFGWALFEYFCERPQRLPTKPPVLKP